MYVRILLNFMANENKINTIKQYCLMCHEQKCANCVIHFHFNGLSFVTRSGHYVLLIARVELSERSE